MKLMFARLGKLSHSVEDLRMRFNILDGWEDIPTVYIDHFNKVDTEEDAKKFFMENQYIDGCPTAIKVKGKGWYVGALVSEVRE